MNDKPTTLVIGASTNPSRYSYMAILRLSASGHSVVPMGIRPGNIEGQEIIADRMPITGIDTVTLYINPDIQADYIDYLVFLKPRRVIFNPGTENHNLEKKLSSEGIEVIRACTLVMLSTGDY